MFNTGIVLERGSLEDLAGGVRYIEWEGSLTKKHSFKSEYLFITMFKSTKGMHHIDFEPYEISGHQIHILFPGQISHLELEQHTSLFQLALSRKNFEELSLPLRFSPFTFQNNLVLDLENSTFKSFLYELRQIGKELEEKTIHEIIQSRIRIILLNIKRLLEPQTKQQFIQLSHIIANFLNMVEEKYKEERKVDYYAKRLNTSMTYLAFETRKYIRVSPSSIIKNRLLLEAKHLLYDTQKSIKTVANELGFEEVATFSHFFKCYTGVYPTEFRRNTNG